MSSQKRTGISSNDDHHLLSEKIMDKKYKLKKKLFPIY